MRPRNSPVSSGAFPVALVLPVERCPAPALSGGVAPVVPALGPHRAGHVAEREDDAGVGTPGSPEDGRAGPEPRQLAPDEAEPSVLRLRRPSVRRERAAGRRDGVEVALLHVRRYAYAIRRSSDNTNLISNVGALIKGQ